MSAWRKPQIILLIISIILVAMTFARPTMELERPTYRYVFVFDITQSMSVMDIPETDTPISRLDYAKQTTAETLSKLPCGTEAGLALFTGHRAFLLITPIEICANHSELLSMLNNIDWRMTWEARSEVAKGIYKSIHLLKEFEQETRLIFLTDGHEAPSINPDLPPRYPDLKGDVSGLIVGVGGEKLVPIPKFDQTGRQQAYWTMDEILRVDVHHKDKNTVHLSSLRETYLERLADKTGLTYYRLDNAENLAEQMKNKILSIPKIITTDMRWLLALGSLLVFIATMLIDTFAKNTLFGRLA